MAASADRTVDAGLHLDGIAAAVLDDEGIVVGWSRSAARLVGRSAEEMTGRPVRELLVPLAPPPDDHGTRGLREGFARLRHRCGSVVEVAFALMSLGHGQGQLALALPADSALEWQEGASFLRALFAQNRIAVGIHDTDLRIARTNVTPDNPITGFVPPHDGQWEDLIAAPDAADIRAVFRQVLRTGVPVLGKEQTLRIRDAADHGHVVNLSAFRLEGTRGEPSGVASLAYDTTEEQRTIDQRRLLREAARIGSSLNVSRCAQQVANVLAPGLGDLAVVDVAEAALTGEEPPKILGGGLLHVKRAATATARGRWPADLLQQGERYPALPDNPRLRALQRGRAVIVDRADVVAGLADDPDLMRLFLPDTARCGLVAPLMARGRSLGMITVWRTGEQPVFEEGERMLLSEIASRAALGVDNARRYTREHRAAVALQERLLPQAATDTTAVEAVGTYRPAEGGASISGDWFDVITLPSLRVALVIGDVVGHGLAATATMGRLRTALLTLADLELDPAEVLTRLDELIQRLASEDDGEQPAAVGATCLYAVYDPVTRLCTMASAGHPPPFLIRDAGSAEQLDVTPGPPLGVGGVPFESSTMELEAGSVLALYTDGLFGLEGFDVERGTRRIGDRLRALCGPESVLQDVGSNLLDGARERPRRDDMALLLARTRALPATHMASWQLPADPASVAAAREATVRQLDLWGLDELALTTELIISELVTNAIRHAGGPVGVRLIRDSLLICEVSDPSNTQPRLVRAETTDEGGRGLYIVAQCTTRWGSRYGRKGKTIWTEQPLAAGR